MANESASLPTKGMDNFVTLIKRLDVAVTRLEDACWSLETKPASQSEDGAVAGAAGVASQPQENVPETIAALNKLINEDVAEFARTCKSLGGALEKQGTKFFRCFQFMRNVVFISTKAKKPDQNSDDFMGLLMDLSRESNEIMSIRDDSRGDKYFDHLQTVVECVTMFGWLYQPKPVDAVQAAIDSKDYFAMRMRKNHVKEGNEHEKWLKELNKICAGLLEYCRTHFKDGLTWNSKDGKDLKTAAGEKEVTDYIERVDKQEMAALLGEGGGDAIDRSATPKASAAGAPPPPPPPPPPGLVANAGTKTESGAGMGAVFKELSKGESVTSGLRKVDPSQQTHKNPALRDQSPLPAAKRSESLNSASSSARGKSPVPARKPASLRSKKPPRMELVGNKWDIENYEGNPDGGPVRIPAELSHSINISNCNKVVFEVTGKANTVQIFNSTSVGLILQGGLVSSCEAANVRKLQLLFHRPVPAANFSKVDGAELILRPGALSDAEGNAVEPELLTNACDGVNLILPGASEEDDDIEEPVPTQFRTVVRGGKAFTEVVPLSST